MLDFVWWLFCINWYDHVSFVLHSVTVVFTWTYLHIFNQPCLQELPQLLRGKESACNTRDAGDTGSISGSGRSPGGENHNPVQYSCWAVPWTEEPGRLQSLGLKESDTSERLSIMLCINLTWPWWKVLYYAVEFRSLVFCWGVLHQNSSAIVLCNAFAVLFNFVSY